MCPNASMMPSLARMRLATASSWRSSANESGMAGSLCVPAEWRGGNSEWRRSGACDPAEQIGEFFLDLRSQLGARAGDHGKIRETLERPTGIDDGAGIG